MAGSTWATRELLILQAMAKAEEEGTEVETAARQSVPDLDPQRYAAAIRSLKDGGYIEATVVVTASGAVATVFPERLLPEGKREVGLWPRTDAGEALLEVLDDQIGSETDPGKRGRLAALRTAVYDAGTDLIAKVTAEYIARITGT